MIRIIEQNKNTSAMVFSAMLVLIIAVFLLSVPVSVLADPLAFTAGMAFSAYAEAYGMAAGAGYDFLNTSASDRTSIFLGEFDEWQAAKHSADSSYTPVSIADWEFAHESDVSYEKKYGGPYLIGPSSISIGSPAYYTCMKFNSVIANDLNDFYNWFLNKLGLTYSNSSGGFAGQGGKFESSIQISFSSSPYYIPLTSVPSTISEIQSGLFYASNGGRYFYFSSSNSDSLFLAYYSTYPIVVSSFPAKVVTSSFYLNNSIGSPETFNVSIYDSTFDLYYWIGPSVNGWSLNPNLLTFSSVSDCLSFVSDYYSSSDFSSAFIDPYLPTLVNDVISIPDVTSQDYVAEPVETVIGISWDDLYADQDAIELVAPLVAEQAVCGTLELVEEVAAPIPPTDVQIPFLPVNLPSFALGLSGIWHYVREWVGSLRSFMGVLFGIWNGLPYAMIVPVWASAVIVIVLGIYKRFFM